MVDHRSEKRRIGAVCLGLIFSIVAIADVAQASGLDPNRFKNGMVYGLTDIDQNTLRFCSGDLYGLQDENGRVVLPPKYSDVEYCGHGIFLVTDVQKSNKYYFGDKRHFFNRDGVELPYALPDKSFLLNIFSFGDKADQDPNLILDKFSLDTIFLFGDNLQQGLCDLNGKVLTDPIRGNILFLEPGLAFVNVDGGKRSILNLKTWSVTPTNLQRNSGSVPRSRIPWPSNYQVPMPFPKDRFEKAVRTDNGLFDHDYWCEKRNHPILFIDMFNRFLTQYNLIGMMKNQVAILLGAPDTAPAWSASPNSFTYRFPSEGCTPIFFGVKIYTKNEQVISWSFVQDDRMSSTQKESEAVTTNVVVRRPRTNGRLIMTRIGEAGAEREIFPSVDPK